MFECVGRPGVVQAIIDQAPRGARVVVVGNALEPCTIDQVKAFNLELELIFAMNYSAAEFATTLGDIAEDRIDTRAMLTETVTPGGIEQAFDDLSDAERHAKIVMRYE